MGLNKRNQTEELKNSQIIYWR